MLPIMLRRTNRNLGFDDPLLSFAEFEHLWDMPADGSGLTGPHSCFNVDIWDNSEHVYLEAELPGMDRKDISLTVENDVLTIQGEKIHENMESEHSHYLWERCYGSFSRRFTLPTTVDHENIEAKLEKGVLRVILNKPKKAEARRIEVEGQ